MKLFETIYSMISGSFSSICIIHGENIIVIFKDMQKFDIELSYGNTVAIVNRENTELVDFVSSTKLPAITCGLSNKDTVTLSSIDVGSAVITLQRDVTRFDGAVAEPQEIPVKFSGTADNFSLMATAAVLILTGQTD